MKKALTGSGRRFLFFTAIFWRQLLDFIGLAWCQQKKTKKALKQTALTTINITKVL
ncbi:MULTISPECIES: hypothetical protein [Pseudomonas]|uniref:hypothetical protein n=1 Tax=Pseudomonas TaxID=286 RepID=UPI0018AA5F58|nr:MULTISPECIES: hypothetical protein [Pseudomonas]MBF8757340.1 hypothetical protein [Pseudomonas guariconensis]